MTDQKALAQIGVARNFARHDYTVAVYNRSTEKTDAFMAEYGKDGDFIPSTTIKEFVASLERPRRALIMVQAGEATDAVIAQLADAMDKGDIIIDGGNSLFTDTIRREADMSARGLHFVGAGISGGEEGALNGPSIMPGGPAESYESLGWSLSPPMLMTFPAAHTLARMVPVTLSRWCTMASSTPICR